MSRCIQFSDVDQFLTKTPTAQSCLADSSFLVAISNEEHPLYDDAQFLFEKMADYGLRIFVSVTARSEFIDYHRRLIITETLMDMLAPSSKWRISANVREALKKQKGWIDNQPSQGSEPYLSDSRIKICKQTFLPKTQSGHIGWTDLCKEYLSGRLLSAWVATVEALDLNYIDMRAEDSRSLFRKDLQWEEMYRLAEDSALGSQDAMILNLFDSSIFPLVVTMDFDLAYGVLASTTDKVAFVPDSLYRNRIKKLRF